MRTRTSLGVGTVALVVTVLAWAGDWQPNAERKFELNAPVESVSQATPSEDMWVESLVGNLKRSGANPAVVFRFVRSRAELRLNGKPQQQNVFFLRERPDMYLITAQGEGGREYADILVDFRARTVQAPGWGEALFVSPSRNFCVAVFDSRNWLGGIPVQGGSGNPTFNGRVATWY